MVQQSVVLMYAAGRRRSPEIRLVMRRAGAGRHGLRIRPHSARPDFLPAALPRALRWVIRRAMCRVGFGCHPAVV